MRLSDLMGSRVVAADGRRLGTVLDVRLVQDGPPRGAMAALRVDALVIRFGLVPRLIGYGHTPAARPWVVHTPLSWLDKGRLVVGWDDVDRYGDGVVTLKPGAEPERAGPRR